MDCRTSQVPLNIVKLTSKGLTITARSAVGVKAVCKGVCVDLKFIIWLNARGGAKYTKHNITLASKVTERRPHTDGAEPVCEPSIRRAKKRM